MENILKEEESSNKKEKKKVIYHESNLKKQKVTKIWLMRKMESNPNKKKADAKKTGIEKIHYEKHKTSRITVKCIVMSYMRSKE